jgi:hypothetical protein
MAVTAQTTRTRVELRPIAPEDADAVGAFLHSELNERVPAAAWARAVDVPWDVEHPNAGFMLLEGERIVGALLAFYSQRTIGGRTERFCNLGAWMVLPEHRFHSLRLLKALLAQDGYHFTDLSPSGSVPAINERLGFRYLDTTTALMPNVPWPSLPGRTTVSSDPAVIERTLAGRELQIYRDHAATVAARHLVIVRGAEHCYVIFRKDRRKGVGLFASILYVSDPAVFAAAAGPLGRHLLLRHGAAATLVERAVVADAPPRSFAVASPRRKMFRSAQLEPRQIDYLYSELTCLSW